MANRTKRTLKKEETFLEVLRQSANVSKACKAAGIGRTAAYEWAKNDSAFALAWDEALEEASDSLEEEARRRAVKGTTRPVYQGGKKVGSIQEYSDTLLIFLLKGARPQKYRERYEHSGPDGQAIPISIVEIAAPKDGD
jgi:hypothetical protein